MADMTFNTPAGQVVDRKLLILYLNTGTNSAPVWSPIGKRVEDSSMEYDYSEESKTDIFGNTYTTSRSLLAIAATFCSLIAWFQIFTCATSPESSSQGSKLCVIVGFFMVV